MRKDNWVTVLPSLLKYGRLVSMTSHSNSKNVSFVAVKECKVKEEQKWVL